MYRIHLDENDECRFAPGNFTAYSEQSAQSLSLFLKSARQRRRKGKKEKSPNKEWPIESTIKQLFFKTAVEYFDELNLPNDKIANYMAKKFKKAYLSQINWNNFQFLLKNFSGCFMNLKESF